MAVTRSTRGAASAAPGVVPIARPMKATSPGSKCSNNGSHACLPWEDRAAVPPRMLLVEHAQLETIAATFQTVFPDAYVFASRADDPLPVLALVGFNGNQKYLKGALWASSEAALETKQTGVTVLLPWPIRRCLFIFHRRNFHDLKLV